MARGVKEFFTKLYVTEQRWVDPQALSVIPNLITETENYSLTNKCYFGGGQGGGFLDVYC